VTAQVVRRWAAAGLAGLAVVTLVVVLPGQSWWPGWSVVGAWWWLPVIAVLAGTAIRLAQPVPPPVPPSLTAATQSTPTVQSKQWNWSAITSVITAGTALGALIFTGLSLSTTEQGQITDRYSKAVEQIGTQGPDHLETRLGGIYALERLSKDSPRDQPTIIEVLSAFVRSNAARPAANSNVSCPAHPGLDVQAALTVLGRRNFAKDQDTRIDLASSCLSGANLSDADLFWANLSDATLADANLTGANLTGVDFARVHLSRANLTGANLTGVHGSCQPE